MRHTVLWSLIFILDTFCAQNLISNPPISKLVENFKSHISDSRLSPELESLQHSKWRQDLELSPGHILHINWIFHSSMSLQDRLNASKCEVVTWVISLDDTSVGLTTCLWSMSRADHCNHFCSFPSLSFVHKPITSYHGLLQVVDDRTTVSTHVIPNNANNATSPRGYSAYPGSTRGEKDWSTIGSIQDISAEAGAWDGKVVQRQLRVTSEGNEWTPLSSNKLSSLDGIANENFGSSVSVSGDYLAVGAVGTKDFQGRVFIFQRLGVTMWRQEYFALLGDDDYTNDFFGWSCSLSGDAVAVGAYQTMHVQEEKRNSVGAVYIYLRVSAGWINEGFLQVERNHDNKNGKNEDKNNQQLLYDHFGWAVSLHKSTLVVGAYGDSTAGTSAGAAYVFDRYNHVIYSWSCSQKLVPHDGSEYDAFGWSVSLYKNVTAIGAYGHSSTDLVFNGAVYIFQRMGQFSHHEDVDRLQSWTQTTMLLPADGGNNDFFGWDVAIWRNILAIGSHSWMSDMTDDTPLGAVYAYSSGLAIDESPSHQSITQVYFWELDQKIVPKDSFTRYFGNSIALSENTLLVGSFGDEYSTDAIGQAFIYSAKAVQDVSDETVKEEDDGYVEADDEISQQRYMWVNVAKLVPNTTEVGIDFGFSIDIDDATAVVGAVRADGRVADTGAAFVFIKSNTKFTYPMSERTRLALISFLPIFFLSVFCIIGSTMACMKLKPSSTFLTLVDLQVDEDDSDDDVGDFSTHSSTTMDSSVYSETELIQRSSHNIDYFSSPHYTR